MTEPVKELLPKETELTKFSEQIEEVVNYGTHILKWDLDTVKGKEEQLVIILLFRHYLQLMDSIQILIKSCSVEPCKILLRSGLEIFFSLEFIFQDPENRAKAYLVKELHKRIAECKRNDPDTSDGKGLINQLKQDSFLKGFDIGEFINKMRKKDHKEEKKKYENLLESDFLRDAEKEFQRIRKKRKKENKRKNPVWYELYNPQRSTNIKELADFLGYPALYETFYGYWSKPTHGESVYDRTLEISEKGLTALHQIRHYGEAEELKIQVIAITFQLFEDYVKNRVPQMHYELERWKSSIKHYKNKDNSATSTIE